jgi:glycosyltransferase involved in cell wall biosynthesis
MTAEASGMGTVTVVIPCFNHGRYLAAAIESALGQRLSPIEIIVIDDGSTDATAEVAARYGARVSYQSQTNAGLPAARNAGSRIAGGDYVVFLDADDVLPDDYLEKTVAAMDNAADPQLAFAYTNIMLFGSQTATVRFPEFSTLGLLTDNYVHATALIRTSLVRQFPYDERLRTGFEDWDFYLTLCEHGYTGVLVGDAILMYRKHESGNSMYDSLGRARRESVRWRVAWKHRRLYARYGTVGARRFARRSIAMLGSNG